MTRGSTATAEDTSTKGNMMVQQRLRAELPFWRNVTYRGETFGLLAWFSTRLGGVWSLPPPRRFLRYYYIYTGKSRIHTLYREVVSPPPLPPSITDKKTAEPYPCSGRRSSTYAITTTTSFSMNDHSLPSQPQAQYILQQTGIFQYFTHVLR